MILKALYKGKKTEDSEEYCYILHAVTEWNLWIGLILIKIVYYLPEKVNLICLLIVHLKIGDVDS